MGNDTLRLLLLLALLGGLFAFASSALAEDPPALPPEEEEPELTGDAKREHRRAVHAILERIDDESNNQIVLGILEELGATGTRADRDALMKFAQDNKNHEMVSKAFESLGKIGGKVAIEFLCGRDALNSRSFMIQIGAAKALGEAKDPRATAPLLDTLTSRRSKIEVVGAAAQALAKSAPTDERVVEALFEYASHRKDTIRSNALEALGYLATDEAIERLREALTEDKNTRARGAAATGMMNSGRTDCIPYLRAAIENDNSMTVKDACMTAIQKLSGS